MSYNQMNFEQGNIFGKTTSIYTTDTDTNCPPDYDENGDPIPCETVGVISGGTSGGGNVDGTGDGSGSTGTTTSGAGIIYGGSGGGSGGEVVWVCNWRDQEHSSPSQCNNPADGGTWVVSLGIEESEESTSGRVVSYSTDTDCPDCSTDPDGGVGVLINPNTTPCPGDPVPNPEIAPQYGSSGTKGALYGCTRYGSGCTSPDGRTKPHAGIDLKSEYGDPIYAMYSGFIFSTKYQKKGAGYYTRIQSTVNGETFLVEYYHLQQDNRILQGNPLVQVNVGDIIGYQGVSGNLKKALVDKTVDSHIHIEVRVYNGSSQWGYDNFDLVDPRDYLSTTITDDGTSEENTNCN